MNVMLPELVRPGIEILFVGLNPGLTSARVGHYYAGPGNLFWRALHESGLTPVLLTPDQDHRLLEFGLGVTDCVRRPTRSAAEVSVAEFHAAGPALRATVRSCAPLVVCFNGLAGYRAAFAPRAGIGRQPEPLEGAQVFLVPSTSAANAGFTREERIEWFRRLRALRDSLRASR